jgi:uncharacterized protein (DUF58 family)
MLSQDLRHELRYIEMYTAKRIRNLRIGAYTSRQSGTGFDFREHRPYVPGDDVRRIDWNVTARLRKPFMRLTDAERELHLVVALDLSPSMTFGSGRRSKRDTMLFIAGCLAFSALADRIAIGFVAFSERVVAYFPPRNGRAHTWGALDQLAAIEAAAPRTLFSPVARQLIGRLKQTSLVCLVSDFVTPERLDEQPDVKMLATKHDVVGVVVEDPLEVALTEDSGSLRVRDLESGRPARLVLSDATRRRYRDAAVTHRQQFIRTCYRVPLDPVFVRADESAVEPLLQLFMSRKIA